MDDLLKTREVAKWLRVSPATLKRWGQTIPFVRINERGDRRYRRSDVEKFLEENTERM